MDTIFFLQNADPGNGKASSEDQENIVPSPYEINIADGGEFLDDGIRMKEQPLEEKAPDEDELPLGGS